MKPAFKISENLREIKSRESFFTMKIRSILAAGLFFPEIFFGQNQLDSASIPQVEIRAERLVVAHNGLKINELDSTAQVFSTNLTDVFADGRLGIWAAQNGPGSLSTLSARGSGGNRTAVVWNGLPLQSTMNGVADGSLLSFFENDKISVQTGGASSLAGSGSVGGTINLSTIFPQKTGWSGNFGHQESPNLRGWSQDGSLFFRKKNGSGAAFRGQFETAQNDFLYKNTARLGGPTVRQTNARQQKIDLQQLNQLVFGEKNIVSTAVWLTIADREIPPTMTAAANDDRQLDTTIRATASFFREIKPGISLRARAGWLYESIFFHYIGGDEFSRAKTGLVEAEAVWTRGRSTTRAGLFSDWQNAFSAGYDGLFFRKNQALFFSQKVDFQQVAATVSGRLAFSDFKKPVPTGSIGFEKKAENGWKPRLHFSRNYNLPTFNDRFWATGGNPNLLPESSWSMEIGTSFSKKVGAATRFSADLTAFSLWIDDWIQWSPDSNNPNFWRPRNHKKVRSTGLEFSTEISQKMGRGWRLDLSANGRANQLRNLKFYQKTENDEPIRKPNAQISARAVVSKNRWQLVFSQNWTVFSTDLAPFGYKNYSVGSVGLYFSKPIKATAARFFFKIDNVWGRSYQVLPFRAMPGRTVKMGGRFSF